MAVVILIAIIAGIITFIEDRKYAYSGVLGWIRTVVFTFTVAYSVGSLTYIFTLII